MQEVCIKSLAVTYFHMGKPHTIIGAKQFHFRVRDGIGWFPLANAARQTVRKEIGDRPRFSTTSVSYPPISRKIGVCPLFPLPYSESCKDRYVA
jgi:hypothetical protein